MHHQPTPALVVIGDSPFDTTDVDPEHIARLGDRPLHTHSTLVAHRRPGFIAPTATAGGDAPLTTHTTPKPALGSTASTSIQPQPGPLSFTATNRTATAAVAVMIAVVLTMAVIAVDAVSTGSADLLAITATLSAGFVGLAGLAAAPTLRWLGRWIDEQNGQIGGTVR